MKIQTCYNCSSVSSHFEPPLIYYIVVNTHCFHHTILHADSISRHLTLQVQFKILICSIMPKM